MTSKEEVPIRFKKSNEGKLTSSLCEPNNSDKLIDKATVEKSQASSLLGHHGIDLSQRDRNINVHSIKIGTNNEDEDDENDEFAVDFLQTKTSKDYDDTSNMTPKNLDSEVKNVFSSRSSEQVKISQRSSEFREPTKIGSAAKRDTFEYMGSDVNEDIQRDTYFVADNRGIRESEPS